MSRDIHPVETVGNETSSPTLGSRLSRMASALGNQDYSTASTKPHTIRSNGDFLPDLFTVETSVNGPEPQQPTRLSRNSLAALNSGQEVSPSSFTEATGLRHARLVFGERISAWFRSTRWYRAQVSEMRNSKESEILPSGVMIKCEMDEEVIENDQVQKLLSAVRVLHPEGIVCWLYGIYQFRPFCQLTWAKPTHEEEQQQIALFCRSIDRKHEPVENRLAAITLVLEETIALGQTHRPEGCPSWLTVDIISLVTQRIIDARNAPNKRYTDILEWVQSTVSTEYPARNATMTTQNRGTSPKRRLSIETSASGSVTTSRHTTVPASVTTPSDPVSMGTTWYRKILQTMLAKGIHPLNNGIVLQWATESITTEVENKGHRVHFIKLFNTKTMDILDWTYGTQNGLPFSQLVQIQPHHTSYKDAIRLIDRRLPHQPTMEGSLRAASAVLIKETLALREFASQRAYLNWLTQDLVNIVISRCEAQWKEPQYTSRGRKAKAHRREHVD